MLKDLLTIPIAHAADATTCAAGALCPSGTPPSSTSGTTTTFTQYITNVTSSLLQIALVLAGGLAVIYLVYMGIQYITSAGSPDKAKVARAGVINAIIGIVIIMSAFFLIRIGVGFGKSASCLDQSSTTCK